MVLSALHLPAEASASQGMARVVPDHTPETSAGGGTVLGGGGTMVTGPAPQRAIPAKATTRKIRVSEQLTNSPFNIGAAIKPGTAHRQGAGPVRLQLIISKSWAA